MIKNREEIDPTIELLENKKFYNNVKKGIKQKAKGKVLDWDKVNEGRVTIQPVNKPFLKYKGFIKEGKGNIEKDIQSAKKIIAGKNIK